MLRLFLVPVYESWQKPSCNKNSIIMKQIISEVGKMSVTSVVGF